MTNPFSMRATGRESGGRIDIEGREGNQVVRIDPDSAPSGIQAIHRIRYEFAKEYCDGKRILDVACGAGYGSAMLAETASEVLGADLDEGAITFARESYVANNLDFRVIDAQCMQLLDASFDTVVSFETIEHLSDIDAYLQEVARVLVPGGVFVVSTPCVKRTTRQPRNLHHMIEFSAKDFEGLLKRYFWDVELFGQIREQGILHRWLQRLDVLRLRRLIPTSLRKRADHALGTVPFEDMTTEQQKIVKGKLRGAHDMIAVCGCPR